MSKTLMPYPEQESLVPMAFAAVSPLATRGVVRAGLTRYASNANVPLGGDGYLSVIHTMAGGASARWRDGDAALEAETLWVAPGGTEYECVVSESGWETMWFSIMAEPLWSHLAATKPHFRNFGQSARMVHVMSGLISESSMPRTDNFAMGRHFAEILGIFLDRRLDRSGEVMADDIRHHLGTTWERVARDLSRPWTIEEIAREASMSESHLHRVVKQYHASTPLGVLTQMRIERAQDLLAHTSQTLDVIAHRVGYASPFALSKAFKRVSGMSPAEYRAERNRG